MQDIYREMIESGKLYEAKEFIKLCLYDFGIHVSFSQDEQQVKLPMEPYKPDYSEHRLAREKENLKRLEEMTPEDISAENERLYQEELDSRKTYYNECVERDRKYYDLICKVNKWHPDEEYLEVKKFALTELEQMRPNLKECEEFLNFKKMPDDEWYKYHVEDTKAAIERYTKKVEEENRRFYEFNNWYQGLVKSIEEFNENE